MSERWKLPFRRVARVQSQGAELVRCGTTARLGTARAQNARRKRDRERETATAPSLAARLRGAAGFPP